MHVKLNGEQVRKPKLDSVTLELTFEELVEVQTAIEYRYLAVNRYGSGRQCASDTHVQLMNQLHKLVQELRANWHVDEGK